MEHLPGRLPRMAALLALVFGLAGCASAQADPAPEDPWGPWCELWRFSAGGRITASPAVDDAHLYVASWDHHLYALDRSTGRPVWKTELTARTLAPLTLHAGMLAVSNAHQTLYLVRAADGTITRELETGWWFPEQAPDIAGDHLAAVSNKGQVTMWSIAEKDGRPGGNEAWTQELGGAPVGPPMVCGTTVWTLDRFFGFRGWALADGATRKLEGGPAAYPHQALRVGDRAVVLYSGGVRWFDLETGKVVSTRELGADYPPPVALAVTDAGAAVVWCGDSWVLWLDAEPRKGLTGIEALEVDTPPALTAGGADEAADPKAESPARSYVWTADGEQGVLWASASGKGGVVHERPRKSSAGVIPAAKLEFASPVTLIHRPRPDLLVIGLEDGTLIAYTRGRKDGGGPEGKTTTGK